MLEGIKEYLPYCVPFLNMRLLNEATKEHMSILTTAEEVLSTSSWRLSLEEGNQKLNMVKRKYDVGLLTQAVIAISALFIATFFPPVTPISAALVLNSFTAYVIFGTSAAVSLPARFILGNRVTVSVALK